MKHCKTCRRNLEPSAYETSIYRNYKTCTECRNKYNCTQCEFKFSSHINLQRHINSVHLKIKDYQCPTCEFKCSLNSNLQHNIKTLNVCNVIIAFNIK